MSAYGRASTLIPSDRPNTPIIFHPGRTRPGTPGPRPNTPGQWSSTPQRNPPPPGTPAQSNNPGRASGSLPLRSAHPWPGYEVQYPQQVQNSPGRIPRVHPPASLGGTQPLPLNERTPLPPPAAPANAGFAAADSYELQNYASAGVIRLANSIPNPLPAAAAHVPHPNHPYPYQGPLVLDKDMGDSGKAHVLADPELQQRQLYAPPQDGLGHPQNGYHLGLEAQVAPAPQNDFHSGQPNGHGYLNSQPPAVPQPVAGGGSSTKRPYNDQQEGTSKRQRHADKEANWLLTEASMNCRPVDQQEEFIDLVTQCIANVPFSSRKHLFSTSSNHVKDAYYNAVLDIYRFNFSYSKPTSKLYNKAPSSSAAAGGARGGRPSTPAHSAWQQSRPGTPAPLPYGGGGEGPRPPPPPPEIPRSAPAPSTSLYPSGQQHQPQLLPPSQPGAYGPPRSNVNDVGSGRVQEYSRTEPRQESIRAPELKEEPFPSSKPADKPFPLSLADFDHVFVTKDSSPVGTRYCDFKAAGVKKPNHRDVDHLGPRAREAVSFLTFAYSSKGSEQMKAEVGCMLTDAFGFQARLAVAIFCDIYLSIVRPEHRILILVPDEHAAHWDTVIRKSVSANVPYQHLGPPQDERPGLQLEERAEEGIKHGNCWKGVLMMSPEVFEMKVGRKGVTGEKARGRLLNPGADIVFVIGAHMMRTLDRRTTRAIRKVRTMRRIAVTCAPLANNLVEYWAALDFTNPGEFGTADEFAETFLKPIMLANRARTLDSKKLEDRQEGRHIAAVLVNRLKRVCIPVAMPSSLHVYHHAIVRVNLDPYQGEVYRELAKYLMSKVRAEELDIASTAFLLQIAASDTFAIQDAVENLEICRDLDRSNPLVDALTSVQKIWGSTARGEVCSILKEELPSKERFGKSLSTTTRFPSSKIEVVRQLVKTSVAAAGMVAIFAASQEVRDAVSMGLRLTEEELPGVFKLLKCDVDGKQEDNRLALETWGECLEAGQPAVMVSSVAPSSAHWEIAPWVRVDESSRHGRLSSHEAECLSGVSTVVMVDCTWSTACEAQVHSRLRTHPMSGVVVYSLVAEGTCEEIWCADRDETVHSDARGFNANSVEFLVEREIDRRSCEPPLDWNFWEKAAKSGRLSKPLDEASAVFGKSRRGSALAPLLRARSASEALGNRSVYLVRGVESRDYSPFVWVRSNMLRAFAYSFRVLAEEGEGLWKRLQKSYDRDFGLVIWDGLERRLNRDGRQEGTGYAELHEREIQMYGFLENSLELNVKLAVRSQWDLYRRIFMKGAGRDERKAQVSQRYANGHGSPRRSPLKSLDRSTMRHGAHSSGQQPRREDPPTALPPREQRVPVEERAFSRGGDRAMRREQSRPTPGAGRGQSLTTPAWVTGASQ